MSTWSWKSIKVTRNCVARIKRVQPQRPAAAVRWQRGVLLLDGWWQWVLFLDVDWRAIAAPCVTLRILNYNPNDLCAASMAILIHKVFKKKTILKLARPLVMISVAIGRQSRRSVTKLKCFSFLNVRITGVRTQWSTFSHCPSSAPVVLLSI